MTKKVKRVSNFAGKPLDFILCITVILLLALGLIMVLSASSPSALSESGNSYKYFQRQGIFAIIGLIAMFIISKIDYRFYRKFSKIAYIGSIVLLLLVAVPGLGSTGGGAKRWLELGPLRFQPSEMAKIALIIFFADYLTDNRKKLSSLWDGFIKPFLMLVPIVAILFIVQDHLSASIIIILVTSIMMITAGTQIKYFLTFGVAGVGAAGVGMWALAQTGKGAFRIARITSFLDPWQDAQDTGWQIIQSLYAIGSGGLFGVGLGNSKQKFLYISEPHTDFIFAVLAEELGFIGCISVILLFGIFIWRGILIAMRAPDMFGSLVAIGVTALIGLQAIINIAVVTSSMPVTGMPLPFFSYGGTSLMILLCCVGILLNISRAGSKV